MTLSSPSSAASSSSAKKRSTFLVLDKNYQSTGVKVKGASGSAASKKAVKTEGSHTVRLAHNLGGSPANEVHVYKVDVKKISAADLEKNKYAKQFGIKYTKKSHKIGTYDRTSKVMKSKQQKASFAHDHYDFEVEQGTDLPDFSVIEDEHVEDSPASYCGDKYMQDEIETDDEEEEEEQESFMHDGDEEDLDSYMSADEDSFMEQDSYASDIDDDDE